MFLAIARGHTLSAAADALDVGAATVSRRIERLERALKVPLFLRHQTGYRLTGEGAALMEQAVALETAALAFGSVAQHSADISGEVRLATAENLATAVIIPALPGLFQRYPDLRVTLLTNERTINLHRHDADLALRMVRPERGHITRQRLGTLGHGLYAHPDYLATRVTSASGQLLRHGDFIQWADELGHLPAARWIAETLQGRPAVLLCTSLANQLAAARAALGLAVLPHLLAQQTDLVCLQKDLGIDQAIWLAIHTDLAQASRVRVVADFLVELMRARQDRLAGRSVAPVQC